MDTNQAQPGWLRRQAARKWLKPALGVLALLLLAAVAAPFFVSIDDTNPRN